MKLKITILLLLICTIASGQTWKTYMQVPNKNTRFGAAIPTGQIVFEIDSNALYKITRIMNSTDSMATAFRGGWYYQLNSLPVTTDSYWKLSGSYLTNTDTSRLFKSVVGTSLFTSMISQNAALIGLYSHRYNGGSNPGGEMTVNGASGTAAMKAYYGGNNASLTIWGNGRFVTGQTYAGGVFGRLDLGTDGTPFGKIYAKYLNADSTIVASGGNSTNWNTAYSWGNHASAGYLSGSSFASYGSLLYGNPSIEGGFMSLSVGTDGQVLKSVTTNPGGTPITTPTWVTLNETLWNTVSAKQDSIKNPWYYSGGYIFPRVASPLIYGGTAAGSGLTFISTSGAGTSGGVAHQWKGGTNGGTTIMTMLNDGKVGIGTTAPGQKLQVDGNTRINGNIDLQTAGTIGWSSGNSEISSSSQSPGFNLKFLTYTGSALTEKMRIIATGNIGIGTTNPTYKTHIVSPKTAAFAVTTKNNGSLGDSSLVVVSGGMVGIGKSDPTAQCDIVTNADRMPLVVKYYSQTEGLPADMPNYLTSLFVRNITSAYGNLCTYLGGSNSFTGLTFGDKDSYNAGSILYYNSDNSFRFRINGSNNKLYINSSGYVGIGTTTPSGILAFDGTTSQSVLMERNTITNTAGNNLTMQAGAATSGATDKDGGSYIVSPGTSTGKGKSSVKLRRLARSIIAATSDNSFSDAFIVMSEKNLSNNVDDSVFTISLPNLGIAGATVTYSVISGDGTDVQSVSGDVHIAAVRKSSTVTSTNTVYESGAACSTGTLTTRWTISATTWHVNNNKVTIKLNANSSLTPTTLKLYYTIHNGSTQTITQL